MGLLTPLPQVRGFLEMGDTRYERPVIYGHWDDALFAQMPDGSEVRAVLLPPSRCGGSRERVPRGA